MAVFNDLEGHWGTRMRRWGQVNTREIEPPEFDVEWWNDYFKRTKVDGITINSGGIVAYYPTELELQTKSPWLGDRDLFGEQVKAAKQAGLKILARLDVAQADRRFYYSHPDWFCVGADGKPLPRRVLPDVPARELYVTCINGPYYRDFSLQIMREILTRYDVDGFFDNGWPSVRRNEGICHCKNCRDLFKQYSGFDIPDEENWKSPAWRKWIEWRYTRLESVWQLFNETCRSVKPNTIWLGNIPGDKVGVTFNNTDWLNLCRMSPVLEADHQGRSGTPLWDNGAHGKLMRVAAEGKPYFNLFGSWYFQIPLWWRLTAKPWAELKLWMAECVASGTKPWWHVVGGIQEDQRWREPMADFFEWHTKQDKYFSKQDSLANVAVYYSPRSYDYYGQKDPKGRCQDPYRGMYDALLQARIPFDLVHERKLSEQELAQYKLIILPNVACMTDEQIEQLKAFVARGGSIVATFETSLYNEWGDHRGEYGLKDVLGVTYTGAPIGPLIHSYWRKVAEHEVLKGFEETAFFPNGGQLALCEATGEAKTPILLTPTFPVYPPETTWTLLPTVDVPGVYLSQKGQSRIAYLPSDLDRTYWVSNNPDMATFLANVAKWALGDTGLPVKVEGNGVVDVHAYKGDANVQVHLVNLTNPDYWRGPCKDLYPIGEQKVTVTMPKGYTCSIAKLLRADQEVPCTLENGVATATVPGILDYEVLVFE